MFYRFSFSEGSVIVNTDHVVSVDVSTEGEITIRLTSGREVKVGGEQAAHFANLLVAGPPRVR